MKGTDGKGGDPGSLDTGRDSIMLSVSGMAGLNEDPGPLTIYLSELLDYTCEVFLHSGLVCT